MIILVANTAPKSEVKNKQNISFLLEQIFLVIKKPIRNQFPVLVGTSTIHYVLIVLTWSDFVILFVLIHVYRSIQAGLLKLQ